MHRDKVKKLDLLTWEHRCFAYQEVTTETVTLPGKLHAGMYAPNPLSRSFRREATREVGLEMGLFPFLLV